MWPTRKYVAFGAEREEMPSFTIRSMLLVVTMHCGFTLLAIASYVMLRIDAAACKFDMSAQKPLIALLVANGVGIVVYIGMLALHYKAEAEMTLLDSTQQDVSLGGGGTANGISASDLE